MDIPGDLTTTVVVTPGGNQTSDLEIFGDVDMFRTTLVDGFSYQVHVETTGVGGIDRFNLQLLDSTGTTLATSAGGGTRTIDFTAAASDNFYLRVEDDLFNYTGEYTISLFNDDNIINNLTTTTTIAPSTSVTSNIDVFTDYDMFRTSLVEGLAYGFTAVGTGGSPLDRITLELRDSTDSLLGSSSGTGVRSVDFTATATEDYFVGVEDDLFNLTGEYTLTVNGDDTIIGNLNTTEFLAAGGTLNSAIDVFGDIDVIESSLSAGLSYGFTAVGTGLEALDRIQLELLDATGTLIGISAGTGVRSIDYNPASNETVFVSVQDDLFNLVGDYELNINADDTIVNNLTTLAVLTSAAPVVSNLDVFGDADVFKTVLQDGLSYGYSVVGSGAMPVERLDLRLLDDTGTLLQISTGVGARSFSHTAAANGDFFAQVQDDLFNYTGEYTLTFNDSDTILNSNATTEVLNPGETMESSIDVVDDVDFIKTSLVAGTMYTFTVASSGENPTPRVDYQLQDSAGSIVAVGTSTGFTSFNYTPGATDDFFVRLSELTFNSVGDYAVSIATNLVGTAGADNLVGTPGHDIIDGLGGNDVITGLGGDDILIGGFSADTIDGGPGEDLLEGGFGDDILDGGTGIDAADYRGFGGGINVNLLLTTVQDNGAAGMDTLTNIEDLIGGDFNDRFTGNLGDNFLEMGSGSDFAFGLGGDDSIEGGDGNDNLQGGSGDDFISGGIGIDTLLGGTGNDFLNGDAGNDQLRGGADGDVIIGGAGRDVLIGGDFVSGTGFPGDGAADVFVFHAVSDSALGGASRDIIRDFEAGTDLIDLFDIDAVSGGSDDAFTFIGSAAFSGTAGELRAFSTGANTVVRGDVDGDGVGDLDIFLNGALALSASDFAL